ncbi:RICIN domain-containing protein [Streptomyces triculaminicus]|uniref:RICIN domain-containing protein n=1 Tax=Streptomyces triculaminicus TaxID=2816232 RepID=A0A939JU82_9ACTN|nr:RICIN domain-containing protein [Streptomyces triculaminicus]MBO0657210.1 RICIN domain-containing protein [Streptomyces triculaminicus]
MIIGAFVGLPTSPAYAADLKPEQIKMATYNSQGARWTEVEVLSRENSIVAVQEAGADPRLMMVHQNDYQIHGFTVRHYLWRTGRGDRHVYYLNPFSDGRVNLAMVTHQAADNVLVAPGLTSGRVRGRPALGLVFGTNAYFNLHALASGGGDVAVLLDSIRTEASIAHVSAWHAMGDFNRSPDEDSFERVLRDLHAHVYRSGNPTHQRGNELDYLVSSQDIGGNYSAERMGGRGSDHYPVQFSARRSSDAVAVTSISNNGRVLDVAGQSSTNGTHIITYDDHHGGNQQWRIGQGSVSRSMKFVNKQTGKCIDAYGGPDAVSGTYLNEWDCQGQKTQDWRPVPDPVQVGVYSYVHLATGLCMDVLNYAMSNGAWLGLYKCSGAPNQKFLLQWR